MSLHNEILCSSEFAQEAAYAEDHDLRARTCFGPQGEHPFAAEKIGFGQRQSPSVAGNQPADPFESLGGHFFKRR